MINVDRERCTNCMACYEGCRGNVFDNYSKSNGEQVTVRHPDRCSRCGYCISICPTDAISHDDLPKDAFEKLADFHIVPDAIENLIFSRRSTRCFKKEAVPRNKIERMIEAATHAGTGSNLQLENIIVVQDRRFLLELERAVINVFWNNGIRFFRQDGLIVKTLSKIYGHELTSSYKVYHQFIKSWKVDANFEGKAFYNAPLLIIIHGQKANRINQANCAIAISNIELLAQTMGLATCWSGWLIGAADMSNKINKFVGIDKSRKIGGAVMVGYPKYRSRYKIPRKKREVTWI